MAESVISRAAFNAKLATVTLTSEASTRKRSLTKSLGHYLDSPDLAKKYEGKPEQLKNVRERTDKKYCSKRGVWFYKNPEYHSDDEDETATINSWSRKLDVTEPKANRPNTSGPTKPPVGKKHLRTRRG